MTSRTRLARAAFLLAVAAGLFFAFAPLGTTCTAQPGGQGRCFGTSIFETDGSWVLVMVAVPIAIALVPVLVRRRATAVVSAVLLWACCIVGIASGGMLFVPAAVLMTIAATRRDPEHASMDRRVTSEA